MELSHGPFNYRVSKPATSLLSSKNVMTISTPIFKDKALAGVAVTEVLVESLTGFTN